MSAPPVRVLHVLHTLGVGGAERRVLRLGQGLDAGRYDVHALTLRPTVGAELPWPAARHTHFPISSGVHPDRLVALSRFMRRGRFRIVHTHNWATMFYGVLAARLAGVPVVLHGEHGRNDVDRVGISFKREAFAALLARLATRVVAVNESIAADVQARWRLSAGSLVCLPNGVDLARFGPPTGGGEPRLDFVIGTIARFDRIKNLPCLIRAFELLHDTHAQRGVRLVIVGSGPDFGAIQTMAQQSRAAASIELVGETDVPQQWYARFDVFASTSFSEGMSNSVLEAMACGLPIVASAIAGHQCWLRENENTLFFPSDDAAALADCLARLVSDQALAQRMGAQNLRRVQAEYDNRHFLAGYDALYHQLLPRGS